MLEGVDYSHARPGGAKLQQQGKRFVVRYLYPNGDGTGKGLTAAELHDLRGHGIAVACVYEGAAGDMRKGHGQGVADARLAQGQLDSLPLDGRLPVYFAKDYDGGLGAAEKAYLAGAASVIGAARVGLYGGWQAIDDAISGRHAAWFWQTYAWSAGRVHAGIHLFQYSNGQWGGQVDYVRAVQTEYGQHPVPATPTPPTPAPAPAVPAPTPAATRPPLTLPEEDTVPIYFKGDVSHDVFVYNPYTGTKRHISRPEYTIVTGNGIRVVHVSQADADAIPAG